MFYICFTISVFLLKNVMLNSMCDCISLFSLYYLLNLPFSEWKLELLPIFFSVIIPLFNYVRWHEQNLIVQVVCYKLRIKKQNKLFH